MNNYERMCPGKVRLYDAFGDFIGTANACPKETHEDCGAGRCGMPVPKDWYCRTETYRYGEFYEGKVRKVIRCAGPLIDEFFNDGIWDACRGKPKGYPIATAYDEKGKPIERFRCGYYGGGDGTLAAWAGMEAGEAEGSSGDQDGPPTDHGGEGGASLTGGGTWSFGWPSPVLDSTHFPPNDRSSPLKQMGSPPTLDKTHERSVGEASLDGIDRAGFLRSALVLRGAFGGDRPVSSVTDTSRGAKADTVWRFESVVDELEGDFQAVTAQVTNLLSRRTIESFTSASTDSTDRTADDRHRRKTAYPAGEPVGEGSPISPEASRDTGEPTRTSVVSSQTSGLSLAIGGLVFCGGTALALAVYSRLRNAVWRNYE